jgi:RimJ/RimL family protein N-acetyltransferase
VSSLPLNLTLTADAMDLSRPTDADIDGIVAACQDPDIQRYTMVPRPYTPADARGYVRFCEERAEDGSALCLLGRDRSGQVIGSFSLVTIGWKDRAAEVGFWVAPWARRQGMATTGARAICRWAFDVAGLERIDLEAATTNLGSNAVARRLGFTYEGTRRRAAIEGATSEPDARRMDMNVWGLLPGELQ